ncbi:pyruvate kinase [Mycoplasmatota bacterium]|nr:pyruvate kinase [Mycoplasmatota bacterium]
MNIRKTKIICTLGPASDSKKIIKELALAGMNVARLNFSHGNHQEQGERIQKIREVNKELQFPVAILLDTKGPEIRTHEFENGEVEIIKGSIVRIHMKEILGNANEFSVTYEELINDVKVGDKVLIDDGYLVLDIINIDETNKIVETRAVNTHEVKSRRGVNLPNVKLKLPFISIKDRNDIEFGCDQRLDFIAASFVRDKFDILDIRKILKEKGNDHIQIIAKIENQQGYDNLEEILEVADGVMVARGDLGVEVNVERVPLIQRKMIEKAHIEGKIIIIATQMLESMIENITPTRAEVSDIANAVLDGTDAIMLSGETAVGNYPVKVVKMMSKIALTIEPSINYKKMFNRIIKKPSDDRSARAVAVSTAQCVESLPIVSIICPSMSGYTARLISQFRPKCSILALVRSESVARGLALNWGVFPTVMGGEVTCFEEMVSYGVNHVMKFKKSLREFGDRAIVTAGLPFGKTTAQTNTMQIVKFKDKKEWLDEWNS